MAGSIDHVLVEDTDKAEVVIKELKDHLLLSVDCEGVNLGRDGELCLMQVATANKVYLFDIVKLKEKVFDMGM